MLADNLRAVVSQRLLPRTGGQGRLPAVEIMINTPTIRDYILDPAKTALMRDSIQSGASQYKMQSFDQAMLQMVQKGLVTPETAIQHASRPNEFALYLQGILGTSNNVFGTTELRALGDPLPERQPDWIQRKAA